MHPILKQLIEAADKHTDEKALGRDAALIVLFPLVDKFVKGTDATWDDSLWEATKVKILKAFE